MKDIVNPSKDSFGTKNVPDDSMFREVTRVFPSAESEAFVNSFLKHLVSLRPNPALHELCHGGTYSTWSCEVSVPGHKLMCTAAAQCSVSSNMNASEQSLWGTSPHERVWCDNHNSLSWKACTGGAQLLSAPAHLAVTQVWGLRVWRLCSGACSDSKLR